MHNFVSIILPVYNCEKYIEECITSIINQTHRHFELIIIDDGSTDSTLAKIKNFNDKRIRLYHRENKGLIYTLNELVKLSRYSFIARMDADDICLPTRLEEQIKTILNGYDIVSSNAIVINADGKRMKTTNYPLSQSEIITHICFNSPFIHPAVMAKKEVFEIGYSENYVHAEDYCLWIHALIKEKYKACCIKSPLLKYRIHNKSVSQENLREQAKIANKLRINEISQDEIDKYFSGESYFVKRDYSCNLLKLMLSGLIYWIKSPTLYKIKIVLYVVRGTLKHRDSL